jgi:hypothetical protein
MTLIYGPAVQEEFDELAAGGLASMMGWTAPHSSVTGWSDDQLAAQLGLISLRAHFKCAE